MKYEAHIISLKDGRECILRSGEEADAAEVLSCFNKAHGETDFLLSYPGEKEMTTEQEAEFLVSKLRNGGSVEIVAFIDGRAVGTAGFSVVGDWDKLRHRAEFGICILREYWGLGIGRALTEACIECARAAGCTQLELEVVSSNSSARALYSKCGFVEFGRNPRGFRARSGEYMELVAMRLELE